MTTLYGLKNCDTCRKAMKDNPSAAFVDIRSEADLAKKVPHWLNAVGAEKLVNAKSTTWRALSDADKAVAKAYGVKRSLLPVSKRVTFVIGTDRKLIDVIASETDMDVHADQALASLSSS